MKKCPYCAEEIQDEAIKCKHCQTILNKPKKSSTNVSLQPKSRGGVVEGKKYQVEFYGEIFPGADIESVKDNLSKAFKVDKRKIEFLFTGKKKVVKKDASKEACEKTKKFFESAGAVCSIIPQAVERSPAPPPEEIEPEKKPETVFNARSKKVKGGMFCSKCGSENSNEAACCSQCGEKLTNGAGGKAKWFCKTWFIVLLLFLFPPAGIILMWLQKPQGKFLGKTITRILLTIFFIGYFLALINPDEQNNSATVNNNTSAVHNTVKSPDISKQPDSSEPKPSETSSDKSPVKQNQFNQTKDSAKETTKGEPEKDYATETTQTEPGKTKVPGAAILIGVLLIVAGFIYGGVTLYSYVSKEYDYNIFSIKNLFMGVVALVAIIISFVLFTQSINDNTGNIIVLLGFSGIMYLIMYFVNFRKSNWWIALISVGYQIAASVLIVLIIAWFFRQKDRKA